MKALFVTVYQEVKWNSKHKSSTKQLTYQSSAWFNADFGRVRTSEEADWPIAAVINFWDLTISKLIPLFQCDC